MSRRAAVSSSRRLFLQGAASVGVLGTIGTKNAVAGEAKADLARRLQQAAAAPVLRRDIFPRPIVLSGVELLRSGRHFIVRARSKDGAEGLAEANGAVLDSAWPILTRRVAPFFAGQDARDLDSLLEGVYLREATTSGRACRSGPAWHRSSS
jgi:hypothetical protein